jgi:hypothetical protein
VSKIVWKRNSLYFTLGTYGRKLKYNNITIFKNEQLLRCGNAKRKATDVREQSDKISKFPDYSE